MDTLGFSKNWNNKLACPYFTTIRLHDPKRFYVGAEFDIVLQKKTLKGARIIDVRSFTIDRINDFISYLDSGLNAGDLTIMLQTMYKNYCVNWNNQLLDFILFETFIP
jgi:hypothetical protein